MSPRSTAQPPPRPSCPADDATRATFARMGTEPGEGDEPGAEAPAA